MSVAHPISFQLPASRALAGASCLLSGAHQQPHCQVLSCILAKGGTGLVPMAGHPACSVPSCLPDARTPSPRVEITRARSWAGPKLAPHKNCRGRRTFQTAGEQVWGMEAALVRSGPWAHPYEGLWAGGGAPGRRHEDRPDVT